MKREADILGCGEDSIDQNAGSTRRKRRKRERALAMLGLLTAMAAVVYLTATICAWIDNRAQQNIVGTLAGNPNGEDGSNKDDESNKEGNDGKANAGDGILDVDGNAVNGNGSLQGSAVGAAGSVVYSQEELETILSAAVEEGQKEILDSIRNCLAAGGKPLEAVRSIFKDELVVASEGNYHVVPINYALKMHDLAEENLNILETGEYQYMRDGQVVSYKGIDVSRHQESIDWKKVAEDGVEFAFIRAVYRGYGTSGKLMPDPYFDANIKGATENGIKVGVYVFSQAITPEEAVEEANFVLEKIAPYNVECPIVFDVETVYDENGNPGRMNLISVEDRTNYARLFCQTIENAGYRPMIYYNTEMGAMKLDLAALEDYDKWFAAYTDEFYYPYAYDVWQYSSTGKVAGIKKNVDLNISFVPLW